jgi:hypothetical protein
MWTSKIYRRLEGILSFETSETICQVTRRHIPKFESSATSLRESQMSNLAFLLTEFCLENRCVNIAVTTTLSREM